MTFILRIFFSGLIAFVPGSKGKDLTVLLLNTPAGYRVSDGTELPHHQPMLLARAGACTPDCPTRDANIAKHLFPDTSTPQAIDSLALALDHGGAWELSRSDVTLQSGHGNTLAATPLTIVRRPEEATAAVPGTVQEREDYHWVADFNRIDPNGEGLDPAFLSGKPPRDLIAARFHVRNGRVSTFRLVAVGNKVEPIHFQPLAGNKPVIPYAQAVANWVEAEIEVTGDSVEVVDQSFGGGTRRSMRLSPRNGVIEIAVLNQPALHPPLMAPAARQPQPGKHFELYYELAKNPPSKQDRPVPRQSDAVTRSGEPEVEWQLLHPVDRQRSDLLNAIRLDPARGPYDVLMCPVVGF